MKHIVLFSGGANSSYMAYLVANQYPSDDVILLHTPTFSEHPDADRFRRQVAEYLKLPITVQSAGKDIWTLIDEQHCLPGYFIPFCSRILKQEQTEVFLKTIPKKEDFILYFGYGINEWRRIQKQSARFEHKGYNSKYPIFEQKISDMEIKNIIKNDWKICLPESYKYLEHNNCLPCFLGGVRHFYLVWKYYPKYFYKAVQKEKQRGHTVFKNKTLLEYRKDWELGKIPKGIEINNNIPCMCVE